MKQSGWFSKENIDCTDCQVVHQTAKMDVRYFQKMPRVENTSFCGGAGHFSLLELKATDFHQTNANIKLVKDTNFADGVVHQQESKQMRQVIACSPNVMNIRYNTAPAIFLSFHKSCPYYHFGRKKTFGWNKFKLCPVAHETTA